MRMAPPWDAGAVPAESGSEGTGIVPSIITASIHSRSEGRRRSEGRQPRATTQPVDENQWTVDFHGTAQRRHVFSVPHLTSSSPMRAWGSAESRIKASDPGEVDPAGRAALTHGREQLPGQRLGTIDRHLAARYGKPLIERGSAM
jgi:hypothetical protein